MESKIKGKKTLLEKVALFIVNKRKAIYLLYIVLFIFCFISSNWVKVNNDLTDYLGEETGTKQGLSIMNKEFVTYASADVMVENITYDEGLKIKEKIEKIKGVKSVDYDNTTKHYNNISGMFTVTFEGKSEDILCEKSLNDIKEELKDYDTYVSAELGNAQPNRIAKEISIVMVIVAVIILGVLLFTSKTYMEVPVLILTFGGAAIINKGTNFLFGEISFVSNSVAIVLQLALAIDYAIILCHRYMEEREENDAKEATITALCKAIPEISGSCLTTLSGLFAMTFMHYKIGYDMGVILIKAIIISIVVVFTLMPCLIFSFSGLIDKTHHKNFVPEINSWGNFVVKTRKIVPIIFTLMIIAGSIFSNMCPYAFGVEGLTTIMKNDTQIASEKISENFTKSNNLALIVPRGSYNKEKALVRELKKEEKIESITSLADTEAFNGYVLGDSLNPREFSELMDIDIDACRLLYSAYAANNDEFGKIIEGIDKNRIPLIDLIFFIHDKGNEGYIPLDKETKNDLDEIYDKLTDGKEQLESEKYTRIVMNLALPEESKETYEFIEHIKDIAKKYYKEAYTVGNSTSTYDLSSTFSQDNVLISVLSALFVMLVLLFTFQSAGIPIVLIFVIQGSIWINFSFPYLQNSPLFFLSYLVVSSIQMGANIDYAIVITNRYQDLKKDLPAKEAVITAITQAFPTIFTSGSILAFAGFAIGLISSEPTISSIGICLGRGTIISILLVMTLLPQLLILFDKLIEKTAFEVKLPVAQYEKKGSIFVNGPVKGYVNGKIDGVFYGKLSGDMDIGLLNKRNKSEEDCNEQEDV